MLYGVGMNNNAATSHQLTNLDGQGETFASAVNALAANATGRVLVNGREVTQRFGSDKVATAWGTGSVSVKVKARRGSGFAEVWVKTGQSAEFTVELA